MQAEILFKSKRRCPLCFSYDFDHSIKKGQIAHLDQDSENNSSENLVFLCLVHHDEYDCKTSQSKGITKEELEKCNQELQIFLQKIALKIDEEMFDITKIETKNIESNSSQKVALISPEVYKLRLPIYYSYRKFINKILAEATFELVDLYEYIDGTHESLFIFNSEVNEYLSKFKTKAIQFRTAQKMLISKIHLPKDQRDIFEKTEEKLFIWLTENFEIMNSIFTKYLKIKTR